MSRSSLQAGVVCSPPSNGTNEKNPKIGETRPNKTKQNQEKPRENQAQNNILKRISARKSHKPLPTKVPAESV
jgi:hypothetical protein